MKIIICGEESHVEGKRGEILSGITCLLKSLYSDGYVTEEDLDKIKELVLMPDDELETKVKKSEEQLEKLHKLEEKINSMSREDLCNLVDKITEEV